jgi:hypothetical protein
MGATCRRTLAAAAGLLAGTLVLQAEAADLGGDCCADLETRIAELEATTARKGNRKVSLEVSGQVNRALLVWDDSFDSDAYVVDNDQTSTRFRFRGSGTIKAGWKAGFLIEIELQDDASNNVNQFNDDGLGETLGIHTRHASWFIESERLGRVTLGQTSPATDDLTLINLGGSLSDAELYFNNAFFLRDKFGNFTGVAWAQIASGLDTPRGDFVRYDTPSIYGFIFSAAWGENDRWDAAVRYQQEWNSVRIAAGIGYLWNGDPGLFFLDEFGNRRRDSVDVEEVKGALSIMHIPSGLYASFAAGTRDVSDFRDFNSLGESVVTREGYDADFWYLQLGITKRFLPYGATTFFGEYGRYNDFGANLFTTTFIGGVEEDFFVTGTEVDRWGFGLVQAFDDAALEVYAQFYYYEADIDGYFLNTELDYRRDKLEIEDWQAAVLGARIRF